MGRRAKHKQNAFFVIALAVLLLTAGVWHFVALTHADPPPIQYDVTVTATVLGCGDGIIQLGEDCDTSNMNGHTCVTEGFVSGSISCTASCTLNTTSCSSTASGGGSTPVIAVSSSNRIFTGTAYPNSPVTVLKDGQIATSVTADATGEFYAQFNNLTSGTYAFGFVTQDAAGNYSTLVVRSVTATGGTTTTSGIFLSPTISPVTSVIMPGEPLVLTGQSAPNATITLTITSPTNTLVLTRQVTADSAGAYTATVATDGFGAGTYSVTAVAALGAIFSAQSLPMSPVIGAPSRPIPDGDVNSDGRINLIDFSIALYWYKQIFTPAFTAVEYEHLNGDGVLNLVDISIIAYYWTG